jgi:hypothetical protein
MGAHPDAETRLTATGRRPARPRVSPCGWVVAALAAFFFAVGARWIWLYRHGQPFDIDEAGYLCIALVDYQALVRAGIAGWLAAVENQGIQAPLTTALASLSFRFTGPHVIAAFAVPLAAGTGCILAAYCLGKSLGSRGLGLAAAILVASCPLILERSRNFHFSLPATLALTVALVALLRSERFARPGWGAVFGVSLGLMPLARTMTVAFVPGLVLAALLYTLAEPADRARRLLVLAASLLLGLLTAATWFVPNGDAVLGYLLSFGYGARAAEYGAAHSLFGRDAWLELLNTLKGNLYLPHLLVILAGGAALIVAAGKAFVGMSNAAFLGRVLRSPMLPVLVVAAEALLALASTPNPGSAFCAPIVPVLLVASVWALLKLAGSRGYRLAVGAVLAAVAVLTTVPSVDLRSPFARPWSAVVPGLGGVMVTDGRGILLRYATEAAVGAEHFDPAIGKAWVDVNAETAAIVAARAGPYAGVAFGFRHYFYNVNTVNLQHLLASGLPFGVRQVEPLVTGESVQGYLSWLTSDQADACVLLTSDRLGGDFLPAIDRASMEEAAKQARFVPVQQWPAPDGQTITLWQHEVPPANCR